MKNLFLLLGLSLTVVVHAQQVGDSVTENWQGHIYTGKVIGVKADSLQVHFTTGKTLNVVKTLLTVGTPAMQAAATAKAEMTELKKSEYLNLEVLQTGIFKSKVILLVDYGAGYMDLKKPNGEYWKSQVEFLDYFYSQGYSLIQAYAVSGSNPGYQYLLKKNN